MPTSATFSFEFHAHTDVGRVRKNNEDAVAIDPVHNWVVLADGMGGYNAGEVASSIAVSHIGAQLNQWLAKAGAEADVTDARKALEDAVLEANEAIIEAAFENPKCMGMGTTVVAAWFCCQHVIIGHVGDSRCYRLRQGKLQQLTRDHSWLQEQIDAGLISKADAQHSQHRNLVTRALGALEDLQVEINEFSVQPGDLFILCSDGLTDLMTDAQLQTLAQADTPLADKAQAMVELANDLGGRDNISVALAQAGSPARKDGLLARLLKKV